MQLLDFVAMGFLKWCESACGEDQVSCLAGSMGGQSRHVLAIDHAEEG